MQVKGKRAMRLDRDVESKLLGRVQSISLPKLLILACPAISIRHADPPSLRSTEASKSSRKSPIFTRYPSSSYDCMIAMVLCWKRSRNIGLPCRFTGP